MSTKNIFEIGNEVLKSNVRNGATIYKNELFADCKTPQEKKSLRIKLRRKKDSFIATFIQNEKNPSAIAELKKAWDAYSKLVYTDVTKIIDSNSTQENKNYALRFLNAMQGTKKVSTPKKKPTTKKVVAEKKEETK